MIKSFSIDKSLSKEEKYKTVLIQTESLVNSNEPLISNLSNVTSVLKETFDLISWAGFYILKDSTLFLGPFQGTAACTTIKLGSGVCGSSAKQKTAIIVDDVNNFIGHISCDPNTRSEIVIPLLKGNSVYGVLDLDSYQTAAFDLLDKIYLTILCTLLAEKLNIENLSNILI